MSELGDTFAAWRELKKKRAAKKMRLPSASSRSITPRTEHDQREGAFDLALKGSTVKNQLIKLKSHPWILFEMMSDHEVTEGEAMREQEKQGYLISGYNFEGFQCMKIPGKRWLAKWKCYASCD